MKAARIIGLFGLLAVYGCTSQPDVQLSVMVRSGDPGIVAQAERVLLARFKEVKPSFFATVESNAEGSTLHFTFKHGAPEPALLETLSITRGELLAALASDAAAQAWFTDEDIVEVGFALNGSMPVIRLGLTRAAGERLAQLSSDNIGKLVRVMVDGTTLFEAKVNGVLGARFEINGPGIDFESAQTQALAAILQHGALPADVELQR